jgi:hypothetical protein
MLSLTFGRSLKYERLVSTVMVGLWTRHSPRRWLEESLEADPYSISIF